MAQRRELMRRAGLGSLNGKALGAYIIGYLFDEPEAELLERVDKIRDTERERFRAELLAERAKREKRRAEIERARVERQRARAAAGSRTSG
jgi:hypothetical protein